MDRLREAAARHPRWVDAGLAAVVAAVTAPGALRGTGLAARFWFALVHVVLVWRRRAPVTVFWMTYGLAGGRQLDGGVRVQGAYPELQLAVAVYTVARYSTAAGSPSVVTAIAVPSAVAFLQLGPQWLPLAVRGRGPRRHHAARDHGQHPPGLPRELEERARRLERERDQQATIAAAAERARIARDMHDVVAAQPGR
jgi:signal transduction histidine kinase